MFRGVSSINLDSKGRMAMPVRYRERLHERCEGKLVLTIDTDERCLLLYPLPEWEAIEARLEALPSFDATSRRIQRLLIGHATEAELDGTGRIMVPPLLRDYASLQKALILVGQGKKFELWSETDWQQRRDVWLEAASAPQDSASLPEALQVLSI